jgi:hypothetical protein
MLTNFPDGLKNIIHKRMFAYVRLGKGRLGEDVYVQYAYVLNYIFH